MARGAGTVTVKFLGDISDLKKATSEAEGALGKVGSAVGGAAKTLALVGVPALTGFGVAALKAFGDSEQVAAQTGAVLKSTGGAAKVTADHVGTLAGTLSKMSGIDDEVVQSGENMLLTFTNIRNGVGKGNDVFDQATTTMLDMSTALGQDTKTSAIQLGKALNDPVKGISALQRVGVTFTAAQKKQIEQMVKAGDTMGAQKVILAELNKEFGGSAKAAGNTFAGSMNKLKVAAGNAMEDIGGKLAPFVTGFTNAFSENGIGGALNYLADTFQKEWPAIQAALGTILSNIGAWITGTGWPYLKAQFPVWVQAFWEWIKDVTPPALEALGTLLADIGKWLITDGLPALGTALLELVKAMWHWIQDSTGPALGQLVDWMAKLTGWILDTGIPTLAVALLNLGAKLIEWIADVFPKIPGALGTFIGNVTAWIVTTGVPKLIEFTGKLGDALVGFVADAATAAPGALANFVGAVGSWLKDKGPGLLKEGVEILAAVITAPFKLAFNTVAGFWNNTLGKISFSVPDWVPVVGGKGWSFPTIPALAAGGIVNSPTLALIGEAGPEAVVPLSRGGMGGTTVVNNFYGPQDPAGVARQLEDLLYKYQQAGGTLRFQN